MKGKKTVIIKFWVLKEKRKEKEFYCSALGRHGFDPWPGAGGSRTAATQIQSLAWDLPYAMGVAI